MRALWDFPVLPYQAVTPWPQVLYNGQWDWIGSVDLIESWLAQYVGARYVEWTWSMWTLHNPALCGVSFSRPSHCSLFLLRFGN